MKRRYRLYLETSFWDRLGDPRADVRRRVSYRFLRRSTRQHHQILVSDLVLEEVRATPMEEERKSILRRIWSSGAKHVTALRPAERVAGGLMAAGGWDGDLFADMLHVGYTVAGEADALVTWDRSDLARDHTRNIVAAYCRREGLLAPLIGTPEEVAKWLDIVLR